MGCELHFSVEAADRVVVNRYDGVECRAECALELLCTMVRQRPELWIGKKGGLFYGDEPPKREWVTGHDLVFCSTKYAGVPSDYLPIPCPMILRWPQVGIPNAEQMMDEMLVDDSPFESEKIFWIGADTHASRRKLCEIGRMHPDLFDVEMMEWDRKALGGQRSKTRQVSIPDHRKFKYLVDCPGYGYSARVKWLLATGRPVFMVERPVVEHWHDEMQPWVHFVPVAADLSDLLANHARLEADPTLYESIGKNARQFAWEKLTVTAQLLHSTVSMEKIAMQRPGHVVSSKQSCSEYPKKISCNTPANELGAPVLPQLIGALEKFVARNEEFLWLVDESVFRDGIGDVFESSFADCGADFLATVLRTYFEEPGWYWWASLKSETPENPLRYGVAALLPVVRFSRAAAVVVLEGIEEGWSGHPEALIPTLVNRSGLTLEDIGGTGNFTPPERMGSWYDKRTWNWQGPVEYVPGRLHFPVPMRERALAPGRMNLERVDMEPAPRMLYVSPVGRDSEEWLPAALDAFRGAGADVWLIQYDEADLAIPAATRLVRDKGCKWQLALRHLHPDAIAEYDYIFFWDDDLDARDFDPMRFVRIMGMNRLDMAQPAIRSAHVLSHDITRYQPCPPPWRDPDGVTFHPVVGRFTNFVEIMAPVFTRIAWREFFGYLDPENRSGWGYDFIPLGRKGIVDALPVTHTRAVRSINSESEAEIRRFLDEQGLFFHQPVQHGWLFE